MSDIMRLLWRRKLILLAGMFCGGAIGLWISVAMEPVYTAEGVLLLSPTNDTSNVMRLPSSGFPVANLVATERDVIRSPALIDAALRGVSEPTPVDTDRISIAGFLNMVTPPDGSDGEEDAEDDVAPVDRLDLIEDLRDNLEVITSSDSLAVTFRYSSISPPFAAAFVNGAMQSYLAHTADTKSDLQAAHTEKLQERRLAIEEQIIDLEETVETLRREPNRGPELQRRIGAIEALVEIQGGFTRELETLRAQPIQPAAQVVSVAEVPTSPSSPSMPVFVAGTAIVGLLLAGAFVIIGAQVRGVRSDPA